MLCKSGVSFWRPLREAISTAGSATFHIDLAPDRTAEQILDTLCRRGSKSLSSHLKSALGFSGLKTALLYEVLGKDQIHDLQKLAATIKTLPITVTATRPIAEAISSAGGVTFEALDAGFMLKHLPGVFCAGEMLDWEAPTGGYLITACMASGRAAGAGLVHWLHARPAMQTQE